jgi:hypothetical protein
VAAVNIAEVRRKLRRLRPWGAEGVLIFNLALLIVLSFEALIPAPSTALQVDRNDHYYALNRPIQIVTYCIGQIQNIANKREY